MDCVSNTKQFPVLPSGQNFVSSCRILPGSNVTFYTSRILRIFSVSYKDAGLCRFTVLSATVSFVLAVAKDGQRTRKRGSCGFFVSVPWVRIILLLLLQALQLQRSFGLLNEFFPPGPVSDAVPPICYSQFYYIAFYIILPPIFRSSQ